ncbi:MAG: hypothetical protein ABEJ82_02560 [Haloplanus sp.]
MDRREFLTVGVVTALLPLTGCSGSDSTGGNPETAQEHLDKAGTALQNAGEKMKSESEKFTDSDFQDGGVDVKTSAINGYLDTASTELDKAEQDATAEQRRTIDTAREYVAFVRKLIAFLDTFAEGYSQTYNGYTYFRSERYEDAIAKLDTAGSTLSDADDLLTVTQSRYEDLNTDVLDEMGQVQAESLASSLDDMDALVPAFEAFVEGLRYLSKGMDDFEAGSTSMENDRYGDAEAAFGSASEEFNAARSTFKAEEGSAPSEIKSTFIELTCYSGALRDAATHLANSMEAYQNGNYDRAKSEAQTARDASNRCDFSTS